MIKIVLLMLHVAVITIVYLWCTIATAETIYIGSLIGNICMSGYKFCDLFMKYMQKMTMLHFQI